MPSGSFKIITQIPKLIPRSSNSLHIWKNPIEKQPRFPQGKDSGCSCRTDNKAYVCEKIKSGTELESYSIRKLVGCTMEVLTIYSLLILVTKNGSQNSYTFSLASAQDTIGN